MTTVEARALLRTFQTAMLYAVADTDRAERVVDDPVLGMERGELLPPLPGRLDWWVKETDGWWVVPSSTPTL
jgi:hypothetical protein